MKSADPELFDYKYLQDVDETFLAGLHVMSLDEKMEKVETDQNTVS